MSTSDLDAVTKKLEQTKVDSETDVVSFKGQSLKLNNGKDAQAIIDAINAHQDLKTLDLEGNTLGIDAAKAIAEALNKCKSFRRALWSDLFTGRLKSEIPTALKHLGGAIQAASAHLVELDLSDNAFGPNGVEGIVDLLKSESCYTLQELRLNNNGLGTTGGKMLASCLMSCYHSSKNAGKPLALRVFISGRGRLENDGSTALSEVFKLMGSLEEVAMPQNGINHPGIAALSEAFACNPKLRILNLNDNTFTEAGAKAIAKILSNLQNLEVINFGDCLLRTEGAKALAKQLKTGHQKLRELILSGNEISKRGALAIVDAMETKDNLEVLELNSNQLGEAGIEEVKETLDVINKADILGSLSDDEGSEDEDEEDYEEGAEEEDAEEEREGEAVEDLALQVQGKSITPQKQSVKDFLSFPSPTKLHQFGRSLAACVRDELGSEVEDPERTVQTLVRISSVVTQDDAKTTKAVCDCSDTILQQLLSRTKDVEASVANAYLVYLGLIKGEDKKYKPPCDITGPLIVLEHVVKQSYFPNYSRKILSGFLDRPNPLLDKSATIRNKILQTLYTS